MSTESSRKGSHGLGVLLEWIYGLPLQATEQAILIVYAKHADYWDGSNSRPSVSTVAKKARLKSERRVQQILRKLQADPGCGACHGTGTSQDEFGQSSRCDCHQSQRGYLVQTSRPQHNAPAVYRLNVKLEFSANSTEGRNGGVKSARPRGEIFTRGGAKFSPPQGRNPEHRNKEDRFYRSDRFKPTNTGKPALNGDQRSQVTSHEVPADNYSPEHLQAWLAIKEAMRRHLSDSDWKLWVRPARLLRCMSGGNLLIAVPPNAHIMAAAAAAKKLLFQVAREHGFRTLLTNYPDEWQLREIKQRFGVDYSPRKPKPAAGPRQKVQGA